MNRRAVKTDVHVGWRASRVDSSSDDGISPFSRSRHARGGRRLGRSGGTRRRTPTVGTARRAALDAIAGRGLLCAPATARAGTRAFTLGADDDDSGMSPAFAQRRAQGRGAGWDVGRRVERSGARVPGNVRTRAGPEAPSPALRPFTYVASPPREDESGGLARKTIALPGRRGGGGRDGWGRWGRAFAPSRIEGGRARGTVAREGTVTRTEPRRASRVMGRPRASC
jgi:hypothetical protein